ncbi:hypothetical protein ABIE13_000256 [Ottowia thiooxydans]|uniref:Uncharacterized protein n=1 Tax=Ottowia thiooxydans TaxID=219182 RepID=A0ABV2Q2B4_9BURK
MLFFVIYMPKMDHLMKAANPEVKPREHKAAAQAGPDRTPFEMINPKLPSQLGTNHMGVLPMPRLACKLALKGFWLAERQARHFPTRPRGLIKGD